MTQTIDRPTTIGPRRGPAPRPGVVYVPCVLCAAPVDLAHVRLGNQPQLCEEHLRMDTVQR